MPQGPFEKVLEEVKALTPAERQQLQTWLASLSASVPHPNNGITAVLTVGDPPMIAQYLTREPDAVAAFLARYPFLRPLLTDALAPLRAAFGAEPSFVVAVDIDPEVVGWEELRVDVETTLSVDEADQRLEAFDTAWWLANLPRAQGKLFFTLAFV